MHLSTITNRCAEVPQLLNTPPWHADFNRRRAGEARPKGKHSSGRMALAPIRTREFSLPRGAAGGQGHSQLKTSNFYIAHRFFVTFFTEESIVPLRPPSSAVPFWEPPRALAKQLKHFCAFMQCFIARKLHFIHTLGIIYGEKLWITWTTKWG